MLCIELEGYACLARPLASASAMAARGRAKALLRRKAAAAAQGRCCGARPLAAAA